MKRFIVLAVLGILAFNAVHCLAKAAQKGETSHPVVRRNYTYE